MNLPLAARLFVLGSLVWTQVGRGDDWPQYRGPRRDDVSRETGLLKTWPQAGPPLVWTYKDAGIGYSGVAVVGDRLFTIGARGETEFLIALDIQSPKDGTVAEAWHASVGSLFDFQGNNWSAGPSSTPTIDGEQAFGLGGRGDLICVQTSDGKERWRTNLPEELDAQVNPIGGGPRGLGWGFTWSPLVDGDRLICIPGGPQGTVAALDKQTGKVLWRTKDVTDQAAYASPIPAVLHDVRQYVVLTNQGVIGVRADDGSVLWNYRRAPAFRTEVVNSPIVSGDLVYVTVGAGHGCDLLRIGREGDAFTAEVVYTNKNMANHHGNVVLLDGHVYGFSQGKGWICQNLASGEIVWAERRRLSSGALTCAEGRIYAFTENDGTVALFDASPRGWAEHGRFKLPQLSTARKPRGQIWTPPVISGKRLFVRDQELLYCYDIAE